MAGVAITVEGLGKRYRLGQRQPYGALRDAIAGSVSSSARRLARRGERPEAAPKDTHVWALADVSFEVAEGQILGLVGANGAGKTTLLKILSRITEPTTGTATLHGRVGALLEVGTGFHPELTGRENVYLNGAILGMTRVEIKRKFDEIVAFAEVERFIDTPVKFYSSGMYVRLAFAVAAYLEPEILLVDEVLAVGDSAFQQRCLGKMDEVASEGRTVIFVSHNMMAVARLCTHAVLLQAGHLTLSGPPREVIEEYLTHGARVGGRVWTEEEAGDSPFRPLELTVRQGGAPTDSVNVEEPFAIEVDYELLEDVSHLLVQLTVRTPDGITVLTSQDRDDPELDAVSRSRPAGRYRAACRFPGNLLNDGRFVVSLNVTSRPKVRHYFTDENAALLSVYRLGGIGSHVNAEVGGLVRPMLEWTVAELDQEWARSVGS